MNKAFKYIICALMAALTLTCIVLAAGKDRKGREGMECRHIVVDNDSPQGQRFMEDEDVLGHLQQHFGTLAGRKMKDIDLHRLEESFNRCSAVLQSQVYATKDSTLHIHLTERVPIMRLQGKDGGFYADAEGNIFPLQAHYTAWVPLIDGRLPVGNWYHPDVPEEQWLDGMVSLVGYIQHSKKWTNRCTRIHFDRRGRMILFLDGLEESFIFGDNAQIEEKFHKVEQYLTAVRPAVADKKYKSVNVRFNGQIICK